MFFSIFFRDTKFFCNNLCVFVFNFILFTFDFFKCHN